MMSRAAFYRHYQDKQDEVEQIVDEAMGPVLGGIGSWGPVHPPVALVAFFRHMAQYDRLYRALLGRKGSAWFMRKLRAGLRIWSPRTSMGALQLGPYCGAL
jgi:AcrR family transcriptional regulator